MAKTLECLIMDRRDAFQQENKWAREKKSKVKKGKSDWNNFVFRRRMNFTC